MEPVKLIAVDPGHFHAALILKQMYPWVANRVAVYAPLGPDLLDYLARVARFNARPDSPTAWELDVHASPDFLARMLGERAGSVVVLSGKNRRKIQTIHAALEAGLHVLADKPWIIASADLPTLESALALAARKGLLAYDIMTERYEITSILQRELVGDPEVFGQLLPGTAAEPGIALESVHHIMKTVAGAPNLRPAWFFDIAQQGEGLSDVGTHLVDLAQWTAFPEQPIDFRTDIQVLDARRWPTIISREHYRRVTGEPCAGDCVEYYCNNFVHYTLRGVHVALNVLWNWEAPHGDTYVATFRGSRSRAEIRQGARERYRPELFVVPNTAALRAEVLAALRRKVDALAAAWPGLTVQETTEQEARVTIPDTHRVGHEAHFAQVTNRFFEYLQAPGSLPAWESPNMLAKYAVSTRGVELSACDRG